MEEFLTLLKRGDEDHFFGTRARAHLLRDDIEEMLDSGNSNVIIDFKGVSGLTQSFMDELVGQIVLHRGPSVIKRILFKGCSKDVQSIIMLVLEDRTRGYEAFMATGPQQRTRYKSY